MPRGSCLNENGGDLTIFVGVDRADAHNDVCALDETGTVLARRRIPDTLKGLHGLHEQLA